MTPVRFKFLTPTGVPIANHPFYVTLNKAAIHNQQDGFVHPEVIETLTDDQGEALLSLFPANKPYYVTMDVQEMLGGSDCATALRFRIAVPDTPSEVWANDLVINDPIFSQAWDAEAIEVIMQAKAAAAASASAAKTSELNAKGSETLAVSSAQAAAVSETAAAASQVAAAGSATAAADSALSALLAQNEAAGSALAAQNHASNAAGSAAAASHSQVEAANSAAAASGSATAAASSANDANAAATAALASKNAAAASETAAAGSATAAAGSATTALNAKTAAELARDQAVQAAGTVTGVISDHGAWDASSGVLPPKPANSSAFWKITVGGTMDGIQYGVGDTLMYTKALDEFYKIDNTESVSSVNGQTGVVVVTKADVGLPLADNTADADKPVSTAQKAALDGKQPLNPKLTGLTGATAGEGRIPFFIGSAGEMTSFQSTEYSRSVLTNSTAAQFISALGLTKPEPGTSATTGDFNLYTAVGWYPVLLGTSVTNSPKPTGGTNVQYWYLHVMAHAGNVTQIAYPYISDGTSDNAPTAWRSQFGGVWSPWVYSVTSRDITRTVRDSTPGRILKVGDFGLGSYGVDEAANLNNITASGFYTTNTTTLNVAAGQGTGAAQGYCIHEQHANPDYAAQTWTQLGTGAKYMRYKTAGSWATWVLNLNTTHMTSTAMDTGANKLLKVGDFGVGAGAPNINASVVNTMFAGGKYYVNVDQNGYVPGNINGYLEVHGLSTSYLLQEYTLVNGNTQWYRVMVNGTWTAWMCSTPAGLNQSWVNVTASRTWNTGYTNTSGRLLHIRVTVLTGTTMPSYAQFQVNGAGMAADYGHVSGQYLTATIQVPPGSTYMLTTNNMSTINAWWELL